ncbi:monooxygenase [Aeromicrobium sp. PE09-221]|uniref:FAD-dependent urate hydroxylase HpxO n=1 Tax=Aeromicrobium sp. PE09-221 TaxID=1898043 RepID=UPI000B3E8439|nr:FAD-dependent urate hydroxylase HpxO [Aeromicrobium sp. PE09-221]OUZ07066.1 monooxygenase [Aeromicrobium sp. PE09-221]
MKAIVIGGGIGGASAAVALREIGYEVEVYEQVRQNRPVGAAISLWSNGVKCLNYLGFSDRLAALGGRMDHMAYADGHSGRTMCRFSLAPVTEVSGQRPYPVARADLQAMLLDDVGDAVSFGKRLTAIEQDEEGVDALFEDGTRARGDLLIAADGARSRSRAYVVGEELPRRYAGYVNYNGLVQIHESIGPADQWTTYVAEGQRVSVMPVADGRFYYFFDVVEPAGREVAPGGEIAELRERFAHWAPGVQRLLDAVGGDRVNRVEIHDVDPFHTWTRGRVALLGDAAHTTTPDIGQGGCSALEDAIALQWVLRSTTLGVADALRRYQQARSERAAELVLKARKRCDVTHAKDPAATEDWYASLWQEDGTHSLGGIIGNMVGAPL